MCFVSNTLQKCIEYPCSVDLTLNFFQLQTVFTNTTQSVPNLTLIVTEIRNTNCDDSKTQFGQNSRTLIKKKNLKKSLNCNKTQN